MRQLCTVIVSLALLTQCLAQQPGIVKKEITVKKGQRYLNLPVNAGDPSVLARVKVDGKIIDQFTINIARSNPKYWTYFDVSPYGGKKVTIEIENAPVTSRTSSPESNLAQPTPDAKVLDLVFTDVKYPGQDTVYMERDRPQVHFSAQRGWINDPNGLVYDEPEYHMYFQHNPYGWAWGNMHWGHAVSRDLIHWEQLPEAIYPVVGAVSAEGARPDAAFSGSAFLDPNNTGGFRKNGIDPLLAMYTSTGRGECLKMSYDKGRTFSDYEGNPILKHNGRDPKVFWYEPARHWVMVVWDASVARKVGAEEVFVRQHSVYTSGDLRTWTYQSGIEGFFECPELFELPVEGEPGLSKWIMYDAHGRYVVGVFDGKTFKVEQPFTQYEHGGGYFYASQTFNNLPGRRIQIGWGRNITQPGMPFNQAMLFPSDLRLRRTNAGFALCPTPITAINTLHGKGDKIENKIVTAESPATISVDHAKALHIIAEFERGNAPVTLSVLGYELRYDNEWEFAVAPLLKKDSPTVPAGPFTAPTASAPVKYVSPGEKLKIEVIVDKNILEFYVNDGELYYVTDFSGTKAGKVEAFIRPPQNAGQRNAVPRKFLVKSLQVYELSSIWKK